MVSDELVLTLIWAAPTGMLIAVGILFGVDKIYTNITTRLYHKKQENIWRENENKRLRYMKDHPDFVWYGSTSGSIDIPPWMRD